MANDQRHNLLKKNAPHPVVARLRDIGVASGQRHEEISKGAG